MTYNKQTWVDGASGNTPINAAALNHIEQGIADATAGIPFFKFGGVTEGQLKIATGSGSSPFSNVSYVYTTVDLTSMGFTVAPIVICTAADSGVSRAYYATGAVSATQFTAVALSSTNLSQTVPFNWIAVGY